jgi:lysophospholipase L1-like esterase
VETTLRKTLLPVLGVLLVGGPAFAADYIATTTVQAALRDAPMAEAKQIGTVPAGTPLSVEVCFSEGAYCLVSAASVASAFVAGELMTVDGKDGTTVRQAEQAKWQRIHEAALNPVVPEWERRDIVVWGDSLSAGTYGEELQQLLPGRQVAMEGVPGQNGEAISTRAAADTQYTNRIAVVWDRHDGGEAVDKYVGDLAPLLQHLEGRRFVVLSDVWYVSGENSTDADRRLAETINDRLRTAYPDNYLDVTAVLQAPDTRTDGLHLAPPGEEAVAKALAEFIVAKGW